MSGSLEQKFFYVAFFIILCPKSIAGFQQKLRGNFAQCQCVATSRKSETKCVKQPKTILCAVSQQGKSQIDAHLEHPKSASDLQFLYCNIYLSSDM